jgi:hypothetical protein
MMNKFEIESVEQQAKCVTDELTNTVTNGVEVTFYGRCVGGSNIGRLAYSIQWVSNDIMRLDSEWFEHAKSYALDEMLSLPDYHWSQS